MVISLQDAQAFLSEISNFSQQRVASQCVKHEQPIDAVTLTHLSQEALNLGFLPQPSEQGFALWDKVNSLGAMTFNIGFLQTLAQDNASLAFAWHRYALAAQLLRNAKAQVSIDQPLSMSLLSTGRFGLGRNALSHYLTTSESEAPSQNIQVLLADWLDRSQPAVLIAPEQWQSVVWPVWENKAVRWQWITREQLRVQTERRQHGFDELNAYQISSKEIIEQSLDLPLASKQQTINILKQDFIGLLAIATGSLKRAALQTQEFTVLRQQGGMAIQKHPAVQQMLSDIQGAVLQAETVLQSLCRPLNKINLKEVLQWRLLLQPQFCHAASQAMQAHGGVGYMRDVGIEKVLREQNMLRMLAGGLLEIPLFLDGQ